MFRPYKVRRAYWLDTWERDDPHPTILFPMDGHGSNINQSKNILLLLFVSFRERKELNCYVKKRFDSKRKSNVKVF